MLTMMGDSGFALNFDNTYSRHKLWGVWLCLWSARWLYICTLDEFSRLSYRENLGSPEFKFCYYPIEWVEVMFINRLDFA